MTIVYVEKSFAIRPCENSESEKHAFLATFLGLLVCYNPRMCLKTYQRVPQSKANMVVTRFVAVRSRKLSKTDKKHRKRNEKN